jgi:hypothetical protein
MIRKLKTDGLLQLSGMQISLRERLHFKGIPRAAIVGGGFALSAV